MTSARKIQNMIFPTKKQLSKAISNLYAAVTSSKKSEMLHTKTYITSTTSLWVPLDQTIQKIVFPKKGRLSQFQAFMLQSEKFWASIFHKTRFNFQPISDAFWPKKTQNKSLTPKIHLVGQF